MNNYFVLSSNCSGIRLPKEEDKRLEKKYRCPICTHVAPEAHTEKYTIPVTEEQSDFSCPFNYVTTIRVRAAIRQDLFEVLEPYLVEEFEFGQISKDGVILPEWHVLWPKTMPICQRGNKQSFYTHNRICGHTYYQPFGICYVMRGDIGDAKVKAPEWSSLIVCEEIMQIINSHPKRRVFKRLMGRDIRLPVVDKPRDGFPVDLLQTPPELERRPMTYHEEAQQRYEEFQKRKLQAMAEAEMQKNNSNDGIET